MNNEKNTQNTNPTKITDKNWFWILLSLIIAFLLWGYVASTESVMIEKTISGVKIEFQGAEALRQSSDLIVTEQDRTTVNLTLRSTRRVLRNLDNSNVSAVINLNRVTTDGRYAVSYDISYPSGVNPDDITLVRSSADIINFYVDRQTRRTIPVEGTFTGSPAEGYTAEKELEFDPMAVTISGPKAAVDLVDHAYVTINRSNVDKTLQYSTTYDLIDADGNIVEDSRITLETPEVTVTLNVLSIKTVSLDVTVIDGGGATRENTVIRIEPSSVVLTGDASVINDTNKLNLGTINLASFASEYTATYKIVLPNNTENITGVNEATVTVTIVGLSTKPFEINHDNISCTNVPEGYVAEIITQKLPINIRASEHTLALIQENNLQAVADLSDVSGTTASGVIEHTVRIYINGVPDAGVIGEYTVYVTLTEDVPES